MDKKGKKYVTVGRWGVGVGGGGGSDRYKPLQRREGGLINVKLSVT